MRRWLIGLAVLAGLTLVIPEANACSCIRGNPCAQFAGSDAVFTGRVISIDEEFVTGTFLGKEQKVRVSLTAKFEVHRALKGISDSKKTVEVATGGGGGDCGYHFEKGKEYLVMGGTSQGVVVTSICNGTRSLEDATDALELIDALRRDRPETRIYGSVILQPPEFGRKSHDPDDSKPMSGIRVEARSGTGLFFDISDANGRFRIKNIPSGEYAVRPILPPTHSGWLGGEETETVEIALPNKCAAESYLFTQVNGVIRGRLYDANGRPADRNIEVSLLSAETATKARADIVGDSNWTDENGRYEFDGLLPGRYVIGVGILKPPNWRSPFSDIYHPNVLTLSYGQKLENIDFRLPPPAATVSLRGLVLDGSGNPAADVTIEILDLKTTRGVDTPEGFVYDRPKDGTFSHTVVAGRQYRVRAIKGRYGTNAEQSESVTVTATESLSPITLKLIKPFTASEDR